MEQSRHDPTLKEHFTENEARRWIRHLEKVIESKEKKLKKNGERTANLQQHLNYYRNKYRRILARLQFLQEQHPNIDFGVDDFVQKYFKEAGRKESPDKLDDSSDGVVDPPLVIGDVPDGDVPTP